MWSNKNFDLKIFTLIIMVLSSVTVQITFGQSYLLTLGQKQNTYLNGDTNYDSTIKAHISLTPDLSNSSFLDNSNEVDEPFINKTNSTTNVISIVRESSSELSGSAMDVVTVVWYVATFMALATFFLLMTCPSRRCGRNSQLQQRFLNRNDILRPPITPSPSYSEFAPPSYESVMKMQLDNKTSIFVIPLSSSADNIKDYNTLVSNNNLYSTSNNTTSNNNNENNNNINDTVPSPPVTIDLINEIEKH